MPSADSSRGIKRKRGNRRSKLDVREDSEDGLKPPASPEARSKGTLDAWVSPSKHTGDAKTSSPLSSPIKSEYTQVSRVSLRKAKQIKKAGKDAIYTEQPSKSNQNATSTKPLARLTSISNQFNKFNAQTLKTSERRRPQSTHIWADSHKPYTQEELAVHKKKVQQVRDWLVDAGMSTGRSRNPNRRLLVLAGPAGSGKSATLSMLSLELDFEISEWRNPINDNAFGSGGGSGPVMQRFADFLTRADKYPSLTFGKTQSEESSADIHASSGTRKLILVEDLPNVSGTQATRNVFLSALRSVISSPRLAHPVVLIISESYAKNDIEAGQYSRRREESQDVRSILSQDILQSEFCDTINFNPIATTFLRKALRQIVHEEFLSYPSQTKPSLELIDAVIAGCDGDIRSALNALQFFALKDSGGQESPLRPKGKSKAKAKNEPISEHVQTLVDTITGRESSLILFHALGKVLYNKRQGDDDGVVDSDKNLLPEHLFHFARRPSEVDINDLIETMPVDQTQFSLYLHQNMPQFCDTVDGQHLKALEYMSDADMFDSSRRYDDMAISVAGARYAALVSVRGVLMSLPSPVLRRGQRMFKPEFWANMKQARDNEDALGDLNSWIHYSWGVEAGSSSGRLGSLAIDGVSYIHRIVQERETSQATGIPKHHIATLRRLATYTPLREHKSTAQILGEKEDGEEAEEEDSNTKPKPPQTPPQMAMYLSEDDIED